MSILDSVKVDCWIRKKLEASGGELDLPYYSRETVERLLAEHRKQVLIEAAEEIDAKFSVIEQRVTEHSEWTYQCGHPQISDELRLMAESDKGGNEND